MTAIYRVYKPVYYRPVGFPETKFENELNGNWELSFNQSEWFPSYFPVEIIRSNLITIHGIASGKSPYKLEFPQIIVFSYKDGFWKFTDDNGEHWTATKFGMNEITDLCHETVCPHTQVYYSVGSDNYYCTLCNKGQGNLFHLMARTLDLLSRNPLPATAKTMVDGILARIPTR